MWRDAAPAPAEWRRNLTQFDQRHQSPALCPLHPPSAPPPLSTSVLLVMSNQINWGERRDKEGCSLGCDVAPSFSSVLHRPPHPTATPPPTTATHTPPSATRPTPSTHPPELYLCRRWRWLVLVCIELSYLLYCTLTAPPTTDTHTLSLTLTHRHRQHT